MVFSSVIFLFIFLPIFLAAYYITPKQYRNYTALLGSYFFYAWGAPKFVFVLLFASVFDYALSVFMARTENRGTKKRLLAFGLIANLGLLGYFKYANFFVEEFSALLSVFGASGAHWTSIALPIGISFFTFQKVSYLVDVYRVTTRPARSVFDYLLYVALFPQLIAGPIVRYHDIAAQLRERAYSSPQFLDGVWRFSRGLAKKVLLANPMGFVADAMFAQSVVALPMSYAWVGILAYAFQIYFDFSGYSDMAIGLGKMMGFTFLENFNMPYIARTFTEFWRRWHISLSRFMKEYLYIPLGGNRGTKARTFFNLWLVFLLSGLWHGAAWTFLVWGAYHGLFLALDKLFWLKTAQRLPGWITLPLTFVLVLLGWVFFRADTIEQAGAYLARLFDVRRIGEIIPPSPWIEVVDNRTFFVFILAALISFVPILPWYRACVERFARVAASAPAMTAKYGVSLALVALSAASLVNSSFNPFIYFRF